MVFKIFVSCKENDFEIVSNEITLMKKNEILKSQDYKNAIHVLENGWYPSGVFEVEARKAIEDSIFYSYYHFSFPDLKYDPLALNKALKKEKLKGIQSKISIRNNSNQLIESCILTTLIKFNFGNEETFNYIKIHSIKDYSKLSEKNWKTNETLDLDFSDVINFSVGEEKGVLKIHNPKNVTIEYYIKATNSVGYSNFYNPNKISFGRTGDDYSSWAGREDIFGTFNSKLLKEKEILGFGDKILSEDITDLWNENIETETKTETKTETVKKQKNGDLNNSFINQQTLKKENKYKQEKDKLISEGWKEEEIQNGQLSTCYNFKPTKGKVKNRIEVIVGGGTDISIKVMNLETEKCIRYVFINSGTTYSIENIPEGKYYLKIAYGKDWLSKVENGQCVGKFVKNPFYEKGEDILDFNIQRNNNGRSIPSYKLSLDVVSSGISNSFNSQNISENDFNK